MTTGYLWCAFWLDPVRPVLGQRCRFVPHQIENWLHRLASVYPRLRLNSLDKVIEDEFLPVGASDCGNLKMVVERQCVNCLFSGLAVYLMLMLGVNLTTSAPMYKTGLCNTLCRRLIWTLGDYGVYGCQSICPILAGT